MGRKGRAEASQNSSGPWGRLPARPEYPLEVWWWLPGPVLPLSLPYYLTSRSAGCCFSFMGRAGWNLLHRQRALSTMGGVVVWGEGGNILGVSFRLLPRPHLPVLALPRLLEGLAPGSGSQRLLWNVLTPAQRLPLPHPPPSRFHPNRAS